MWFSPPARARLLSIACLAILAEVGPLGSLIASEEVWVGAASGDWNVGSNWLDGTSPVAGVDPLLALRFASTSAAAISASNGIGALFPMHRLIFDARGPLTLSGNSIQLAGSDPHLELRSAAASTIAAPLSLASSTGRTIITGPGSGNLTISGAIAEAAVGQALVIGDSGPGGQAPNLDLTGTNSFSGGVVLLAGSLGVGSASALGSGALVVNGGDLRLLSSGLVVSNAIVLNSDLVVSRGGAGTLAEAISSASPGTGLTVRTSNSPAAVVSLTGISTYDGATTIDFALSSPTFSAGTLRIAGAGSLLNTSRFVVRAGGTLRIDGTATGVVDRLGDGTPIDLRSGNLLFSTAAAAIAQHETIGVVSVAGRSTVTILPTGTASAQLDAAALTRVDRGTVLFRGSNLGRATSTGAARMFFGNVPDGLVGGSGGGVNERILPYALGGTTAMSVGTGFVTYDPATGIRLLDPATEYAATLPAGSTTQNVRLTTARTNNAPDVAINSLVLSGGVALLGTGALHITSGAVLAIGTSRIDNTLDFGPAEAVVTSGSGSLTLTGALTGSGGLTKSGAGTLAITAGNSIAGPLTINAGQIVFSNPAQLGASASPIMIDGPGSGLTFTGTAATLSRELVLTSGSPSLQATAGGAIEFAGQISGVGGLRVDDPASLGTGAFITLSRDNTFTGPVTLSGATTVIARDANLGAGSELFLSGGNLRLAGPWTTNRTITVTNSLAVDTAGFDATWNGPLLGTSIVAHLHKAGAGRLTLTARNAYVGELTVDLGTLQFSGAGAVASTRLTAANGGQIVWDDSATGVVDRLPPAARVTLQGGELSVVGNAGAGTSVTLGTLTIGTDSGGNLVTLDALGSSPVILRAMAHTLYPGTLHVRGDDLGGALSRLVFPTSPETNGGLLARVTASPSASGGAESFAIHDPATDALGPIGVRPLRLAEYATGSTIQNPANGGTTSTAANVLVRASASATGATNAINSLTVENGASVSLAQGQRLAVTTGGILIRGAQASTISGGTLDFGYVDGLVATFGDLTLGSVIDGASGWMKAGPGTLTLAGTVANLGPVAIHEGVLRVANPDALAARTLDILSGGVFDLNGARATVGLLGKEFGEVRVGSATLTLGSSGADTTVSGKFIGDGSIVLVAGGNPSARRYLAADAPDFTGDVVLRSGLFVFYEPNPFSAATIRAQGGSIYGGSIARNLVLETDLEVRSPFDGNFTILPAGSITGGHDVRVQGTNMIVNGPLGYSGMTRTESGYLTLSGANGALMATAGIWLESSELRLNDSTAFAGGPGGRMADSASVSLTNSSLTLTGHATVPTAETIGELHGRGFNTVTLTPGSSTGAVRLEAAALVRKDRGTFAFQSVNGKGSGGGTSNVVFGSGLAGQLIGTGSGPTDLPIVPFAFQNPSVATQDAAQPTLLTYHPVTGLRPLHTNTEFAPSLVTGQNVRLAGSVTNHAPITINALVFAPLAALGGAGMVTVTSGTVLAGEATIAVALDFGSAEANILSTEGRVTFAGPIAGSGGLTFTGASPDLFATASALLSGDNLFTGPLTVNRGQLEWRTPGGLGLDSGEIVLNGGTLRYAGTTEFILNRPIRLNAMQGTVSGAGMLTLAGVVSGPGDLRLTGTVTLAGANTHTGATEIAGTVLIASDAAFGAGSFIRFSENNGSPGSIRTLAPWTTDRDLYLDDHLSFSTLDTQQFDVEIRGSISGSSGARELVKRGAGTLKIWNATSVNLSVLEGKVEVAGTFVEGYEINVSPDATLIGGNVGVSTLAASGTLAPGPGIAVFSGPNLFNLASGSTLELEIASPISFDSFSVESPQIFGPVSLKLELGYTPAEGASFLILSKRSARPVYFSPDGRFTYDGTPLNDGAVFAVDGIPFSITYAGGDGNDIELRVVPEPSATLLLASAASLLARRRRRSH